jgi:hypothetical protein
MKKQAKKNKDKLVENEETTKKELKKEPQTVEDSDIAELEKKKKTYWPDEVEVAVKEYLSYDSNYYQVKLAKYIEKCEKEKKQQDTEYVQALKQAIEFSERPEIVSKKHKIFRDKIQKPLNKLVENIIFNFKLFKPGEDVKTTHNNCVSFVYCKFANFDADQNTKSFSFFGTIAKHYLMGDIKDQDKHQKTNVDYDDHKEEADSIKVFELDEVTPLESSYKLFSHITDEIEAELEKGVWSENDIRVADAIISIFKNHEILGAYNKNYIYQLIKENTGLETKDITYSLQRLRVFYRIIKKDFMKKNEDED